MHADPEDIFEFPRTGVQGGYEPPDTGSYSGIEITQVPWKTVSPSSRYTILNFFI